MQTRFPFRLALLLMFSAFLASCEEGLSPNIKPVIELSFVVTDANGPVSSAVVYLFPFESTYLNYLADNPEGNDQVVPPIASENVAVTNAQGVATFPARPLEGNSFASGNTFIHRPNPIYFRVESKQPGPIYLTNDQDIFKITFQELESGDVLFREVEVFIE